MKKENFITLILGVIGGLLFGVGMCMCLLPEWDAFTPGVVVTAIGAVVLIIMFIARHIMLGKPAVKVNGKLVGKVAFGVFGALVLGLGMCMVMVFEGMTILGIIVGLVGIVLLLCLIPLCKGLK
ncbi:MAG: hypothetical protein K2G32_01025 [Oscillospiraceae bacterium]|nr:hypothetical protein [Oscillospiraceae bacterium]